jgi:predicted alpha/beta-hydrolase family hydrolase
VGVFGEPAVSNRVNLVTARHTGPMPRALLLTPGAGGTAEHRTLLAVERALAPVPVLRVKLPPRPERAVEAVRRHVHALAVAHRLDPAQVVVGGRSYGGRMCSVAVAEGLPVGGLLLLSYPLHPPGHPATGRAEHLGSIDVPVLAVSGRTDPYGTPDELRAALPAQADLELVPGAHAPADDAAVAAIVARWWRTLP